MKLPRGITSLIRESVAGQDLQQHVLRWPCPPKDPLKS